MRFASDRLGRIAAALGALFLLSAPGSAHVALYQPSGGEELVPGMTFRIEWTNLINHTLLNWDLYYSTTGPAGPFLPIALDLPIGAQGSGTFHTYDWVVPGTVSSDVWVQVVQDNVDVDYTSMNPVAASIGFQASVTTRIGFGINPQCFGAIKTPSIGSNWNGLIDARSHSGATTTLIFGFLYGATGDVVTGGQLLVDLTSPKVYASLVPVSLPLTSHTVTIPNDSNLIGLQATLQAATLGGSGPKLCNALHLIIGL